MVYVRHLRIRDFQGYLTHRYTSLSTKNPSILFILATYRNLPWHLNGTRAITSSLIQTCLLRSNHLLLNKFLPNPLILRQRKRIHLNRIQSCRLRRYRQVRFRPRNHPRP